MIPIDIEKLKKAYEEHSSDRVGLGESSGILPNIDTLSCSDLEKAINNAQNLSEVWKPNLEMATLFNKWMDKAKKKQAECNKVSITPIPKKKISKNFTPLIFIAAAVVAGIIVSKLLTNDKQN
jgi:hypothetical protein